MIAFLSSIVFLIPSGVAEEYISADRPSVAVGSSVVGTRKTQLETGIQIDLLDGSHSFTIPTTFRYGLTDNIEVRVTSPLYSLNVVSLQNVLQSTTVEGKVNFYKSANSSIGGMLGVLVNDQVLNASASLLVDVFSGPYAGWLNVIGNLGSADLDNIYPSFAIGGGSLLYKGHGVFVETAGSLQSGISGTVQAGYFWLSPNLQIDVYVQQSYTDPEVLTIAVGGAWKQ